jgi:hypothetical protein
LEEIEGRLVPDATQPFVDAPASAPAAVAVDVPVDSDVHQPLFTAAELLLLRQVSTWTVPPPGIPSHQIIGGTPDDDRSFADKKPLNTDELKELVGILEKAKPPETEQTRALELIKRMDTDGIKFEGKGELELLAKIVDKGADKAKGWANLGIKKYFEYLSSGIGLAIKGLGDINEGRYTKFKEMVKIYEGPGYNYPTEQAITDAAQDALGTAARDQGILRYKLELLQTKVDGLKAKAK